MQAFLLLADKVLFQHKSQVRYGTARSISDCEIVERDQHVVWILFVCGSVVMLLLPSQ